MLYFAKWKIITIVSVVVLGALVALPNAIPGGMPDGLSRYLPSARVNLGLDLAGGAHILYQVDVERVRQERVKQGLVSVRQKARREGIPLTAAGRDEATGHIVFSFANAAEREVGLEMIDDILLVPIDDSLGAANEFRRIDNGLETRYAVTDEFLRSIEERTIANAQTVIGERIDTLGVTEPTIQAQGTSRILVQAPGVDANVLKARVGTTAKLEFQLVTSDDAGTISEIVETALRAHPRFVPGRELDPRAPIGLARAVAIDVVRFHPNGDLSRQDAIDDIARVLTPVIKDNATEITGALYAGYGEYIGLLNQGMRRSQITNTVLRPVVVDALAGVLGRALVADAAADDQPLAAALADQGGEFPAVEAVAGAMVNHLKAITDATPANSTLISLASEILPQDDLSEPFVVVSQEVPLTGESLTRAAYGTDPQDGSPLVTFAFNTKGAGIFCDLTKENVSGRFAAVLDGVVISAPRINTAICQGSGIIEGNFTRASATELGELLSAGALPADLTPIQEFTVGAVMGEKARQAGMIALVIGFVGVIGFMTYAYKLFGVFANIALIVNLVLIVAALSMVGAALTLPGIAGIILTVGMAVDANVLIFERIREEVRAGRPMASAIESGYLRARTTILDANITTLVAAIVLFFAGSGPVKGFAVTLSIGIFTSVFTAFVLSRALVAWWFSQTRPKQLPI